MEVFVTPNAEEDFDSIVNQIQEKWGGETVKQFLTKAGKVFTLLQNYPSMGQIEKDDIRGFQLGYWRDKVTSKSNYARLWDSSHTFYAAHCDYFISNDKRTRKKATVVYAIYDIKTRVLSSNGV